MQKLAVERESALRQDRHGARGKNCIFLEKYEMFTPEQFGIF